MPTTTLTTPIGTIEVTILDNDEICARSRPLNVEPVVINKIAHYLSIKLWRTGEIFSTKSYADIYLRRDDLRDVSPAARKKAWIVVCEAVNGWLRKHPHVFVEAQAIRRAEQICSRNRRIADLREQIAALEAEITDLCDANGQAVFPQEA